MIKLIILDVDGVLTDGRKYYDQNGEVKLKTFCDKDWSAIKRFRALGIKVLFLTGDPFNVKIAQNRNIDVIVNRKNGTHLDKALYLGEVCGDYDAFPSQIVFVGDDIFDINLMAQVGFSFCPSDAPEEVKKYCTVLDRPGGSNVVAELFDHLESKFLIPKVDFYEHLKLVYELDLKEKF